ncbi:MAG: SseB family protein [Elusimicrobiota bacterium]|jgi:hypothetical protein
MTDPQESQSGPEKLNEPLTLALHEAMGGSGEGKRTAVYEALLRSQLFVVTAGPPEDGSLSMVAMRDPQGRPVMPAFTNRKTMTAWKSDAAYSAAVPAQGLFKSALEGGFEALVIDPGAAGWVVPKAQFKALSRGELPPPPVVEQKLVRFTIAKPEAVPEELLAYASEHLKAFPEIQAAWFFMAAFSGESMKLCLGLRLNMPPTHWTPFLKWLSAKVPPLPEAMKDVQFGPVPDEIFAVVEKCGVAAFKKD